MIFAFSPMNFNPDVEEFRRSVTNMLNEMIDFRREHPHIWKPEYEDYVTQLNDIIVTIDDNPLDAQSMYSELPISKYDSFQTYIYNNDIDSVTHVKGSNERTRMLRAKRKTNNCPVCSRPLRFTDGSVTCDTCGYIQDTRAVSSTTRTTSNNTKHTYKQLDALTGIRKAPSNIAKIIDHISLWLTDLHYIYTWLVGIDTKRYDHWVARYYELTDESIKPDFFDRVIDRIPDNMWEYNLFKMFTDELYSMLEYAMRFSNEKTSNMESMDDDTVIAVVTAYIDEHRRLPTINDEYVIDGVHYEIGRFFNTLSLLADVPDDHIKTRLEKMLGRSLTLPGLMFNYREMYKKSDSPPKKYCYQQEFCWITNRTFNTPFIDITKADKEAIATLILSFNDYYKKQSFIKNDRGCNSPLYCCTIACVLSLPYFRKYLHALKFVPVKDRSTASHIQKEFFNFEVAYPELIRPYEMERDPLSEQEAVKDTMVKEKTKRTRKRKTREEDAEGERKMKQERKTMKKTKMEEMMSVDDDVKERDEVMQKWMEMGDETVNECREEWNGKECMMDDADVLRYGEAMLF